MGVDLTGVDFSQLSKHDTRMKKAGSVGYKWVLLFFSLLYIGLGESKEIKLTTKLTSRQPRS